MPAIQENLVTLRDVLMKDPLPPGIIQDAVIEFLRGRHDAAIFGSQAVNIYVDERRATEDIDVASTRAKELAEEIRQHLHEKYGIAVRVRTVRGGIGYRVYQLRKGQPNRHLVDVRPLPELPPTQWVDETSVASPAEVIANKVTALASRGAKKKGFTDARDLTVMLMTFPELKTEQGPVHERLVANHVEPEVFDLWREWVQKEFEPEDEDAEFDW